MVSEEATFDYTPSEISEKENEEEPDDKIFTVTKFRDNKREYCPVVCPSWDTLCG